MSYHSLSASFLDIAPGIAGDRCGMFISTTHPDKDAGNSRTLIRRQPTQNSLLLYSIGLKSKPCRRVHSSAAKPSRGDSAEQGILLMIISANAHH